MVGKIYELEYVGVPPLMSNQMLRWSISIFALLLALTFSLSISAQGGESLPEVLSTVQNLRDEIEKIEAQAGSAPTETEKEELLNRATELRNEKRLDFKRLAGADGFLEQLDDVSKNAVIVLIREDLKSSQSRFSEINNTITKFRKSLEKEADAKAFVRFEDLIAAKNQELVQLLIVMSNNLSYLDGLGAGGTKASRRTFEKQLDKTARGVSSMVSTLLEKKTAISKRTVSTDDGKAKRNNDKARVESRINGASIDLKAIIDLLKQNKKDATAYQQLLIESTGTITADVFDRDVSFGLAQKWIKRGEEWLLEKLPNVIFKILLFIVILILAKVVSSLTRRVAKRWLAKTSLSGLAKGFLSTAAGRLVFARGVLFGLSQLGLDVTALVAGFGVAGIVVGFALQDTLSNFASGLMILFYQPFDTGDLIRAAEVEGVVNKMTLVSTEILTLDNQRFVIPNNKIWQNVIQNVTAEPHRRVDFLFGVWYDDDLQKAESILNEIVLAETHILSEPEPLVRVHELADSSVNFVVRMWVNTDDYWDAYWNVTRAVKDRFDAEGISIPFPQTDVHLHNSAPPPNA